MTPLERFIAQAPPSLGIDFESACAYFTCPTCKGSGESAPASTCHLGGFVDPDWCSDCGGPGELVVHFGAWIANLAIAAGLCLAFQLGTRHGFDLCSFASPPDNWRPGCGREHLGSRVPR